MLLTIKTYFLVNFECIKRYSCNQSRLFWSIKYNTCRGLVNDLLIDDINKYLHLDGWDKDRTFREYQMMKWKQNTIFYKFYFDFMSFPGNPLFKSSLMFSYLIYVAISKRFFIGSATFWSIFNFENILYCYYCLWLSCKSQKRNNVWRY